MVESKVDFLFSKVKMNALFSCLIIFKKKKKNNQSTCYTTFIIPGAERIPHNKTFRARFYYVESKA